MLVGTESLPESSIVMGGLPDVVGLGTVVRTYSQIASSLAVGALSALHLEDQPTWRFILNYSTQCHAVLQPK